MFVFVSGVLLSREEEPAVLSPPNGLARCMPAMILLVEHIIIFLRVLVRSMFLRCATQTLLELVHHGPAACPRDELRTRLSSCCPRTAM